MNKLEILQKIRRFRFRFGFKTLAALVALVAGIVWWFSVGYPMWLDYRDRVALESTSKYELGQAASVRDAQSSIPGLVTIIGDSRLKHWADVVYGAPLIDDQFVSWGLDGTARVWRMDTGHAVKTYFADQVLASGDGRKYFVRRDNEIEMYQASDHQAIAKFEVPFTDGRFPGVFKWECDETGRRHIFANEKSMSVFDTQSFETTHEIPFGNEFNQQYPTQIAISRDGQFLVATFETTIATYDLNDTAASSQGNWNTSSVQSPANQYLPLNLLKQFRVDSQYLIGSSNGGPLYLFDSKTSSLSDVFLYKKNKYDVSVAPTYVAIAGQGEVLQLDLPNFDNPRSVSMDASAFNVRIVAADLEGQRIVSGDSNQLRTWTDSKETTPNDRTNWKPTCFEFSPSGRDLAIGCDDGTVLIYRVGSWKLKKKIRLGESPVKVLCYSEQGDLAIRDWQQLKVFDRREYSLAYHKNSTDLKFGIAMSFSPDGNQLAIESGGKGPEFIKLIDYKTDAIAKSFRLPSNEIWLDVVNRFEKTEKVRRSFGKSILFDAHGKYLISTTRFGSYSYWDFATGKFVGHGGQSDDWSASDALAKISADGKWVAMNTYQDGMGIWRAPNKSQKESLDEAVHFWREEKDDTYNHLIFDFCFSNSSKQIASVEIDGFLKIRDVITGKMLHEYQLSGFGSRFSGVAYSPDDRYIATLNGNGTIYIIRNPVRY